MGVGLGALAGWGATTFGASGVVVVAGIALILVGALVAAKRDGGMPSAK